LVVLFVIFAIAQILNLKVLDWMLRYLSLAILIAIPIIFHPEIRAALERLGGSGFKRIWGTSKKSKLDWAKEISRAVSSISDQKYGGLIIVENAVPLNEYIEKGVKLNGEISSSLIESIFAPNSDLKDGAIIISKGQIAAAKVVLPVSSVSQQSQNSFGSRHLAGISISEDTDALSIIVSQDGRVSVAFHGRIREASPNQIRNILKEIWKVK
jgi:diadenylate cyclase